MIFRLGTARQGTVLEHMAKLTQKELFKIQSYGIGEWVTEPDLVDFVYRGVDCKIFRDILTTCFGNGTIEYHTLYTGSLHGVFFPTEKADISKLSCVRELEEFIVGDETWIGFTCNDKDMGDLDPAFEHIGTYRNLSYVRDELQKLVDQIRG